ncbi:unnamed protein product, partial [Nesidiocoris tenuis]
MNKNYPMSPISSCSQPSFCFLHNIRSITIPIKENVFVLQHLHSTLHLHFSILTIFP